MKPLAFSVVLLYGFSMDKKCVCTVHIINVARSRLIFYRSCSLPCAVMTVLPVASMHLIPVV